MVELEFFVRKEEAMNLKLFAGLAFGIVAFTLFLLWANTAKADIVEDVLGCKSDPCIVTYNPGGILGRFEEAAEAIQKGGPKVGRDKRCLQIGLHHPYRPHTRPSVSYRLGTAVFPSGNPTHDCVGHGPYAQL